MIQKLLQTSQAPSTRATYQRSWRTFQRFLQDYKLPSELPIPPSQLALFIAYLNYQQAAPATIETYCAGLAYVHKLQDLPDPTTPYIIQRLIKATRHRATPDVRLPVSLELLRRLTRSLPHVTSSAYEHRMYKAMFVLPFFGMLRLSEFTTSATTAPQHTLKLGDVALPGGLPRRVIITISSYKHANGKRPVSLQIGGRPTDPALCPVRAMEEFLAVRGAAAGALFSFPDGNGISRATFNQVLRAAAAHGGIDVSRVTSHSFRIGGATAAADAGFSDDEIRRMGRWKSNAVQKYIRIDMFNI